MATRSLNSQAEYLAKMLQLIAEAKMTQDADLSFWIGLETQLLQKHNEPSAAGQQLPPPPGNAVEMGAAEMDMGAGMMGAGAGMMGAMGPGGPPAGMPGPGGPMPASPGPRFSPDMMRRALRGGGIQGG